MRCSVLENFVFLQRCTVFVEVERFGKMVVSELALPSAVDIKVPHKTVVPFLDRYFFQTDNPLCCSLELENMYFKYLPI